MHVKLWVPAVICTSLAVVSGSKKPIILTTIHTQGYEVALVAGLRRLGSRSSLNTDTQLHPVRLEADPNIGKYRIESLSAATFPGALRVIREAFCQDESVCIGTEVNKNPVAAEELLELCADAALDGVSLVAVAIDTGEVASVAFNKIQAATSDSSEKPFFEVFAEERCTQASARALIQWMAEVDGRCNFFEKYNVDCSLEIMFLATLREHRYKKLGAILCRTSIELAKKLKNGPVSQMTVEDLGPNYSNMVARKPVAKIPKICQALWTAEPTQKIGKVLNFKVGLRVSFNDFYYDGKSYSERLGKEVFAEAVALRI